VPVRRWHAELAWLPGRQVSRDVLIEASGERFTHITEGAAAPGDAVRLPGLTLPGFANAHSHAFHRALRGITQADKGTFWTWRERMYEVAARLDPDSYFRLARAVYAEMALAGVTCVGEFHYLHHQAGGQPYADPNAMGQALVAAAAEAGLRMTLLDTCYLAGGLAPDGGLIPLAGPQLRFGDEDGAGWTSRMSLFSLAEHGMITPHARVGAAIHSVRAVPPEQMGPVVAWARRYGAPLHVHLSEQVAENAACQAVYGVSPTRVLYDEEAVGPRTSVVHATHVSHADVSLLGDCQAFACICPTTERDLGDGLAPSHELAAAGCQLTLGSDSHAVIDLLEEARGVEYGERLARQARGVFGAPALLTAATSDGHASLGWPDAGEIAPGAWADLVTVSLDSVRTAGAAAEAALETAVFAATAADIRSVVASGRDVVRDGVHLLVPGVPGELTTAIGALWLAHAAVSSCVTCGDDARSAAGCRGQRRRRPGRPPARWPGRPA
jgi:formiminoglutamate deiminase